jgi:hypothetical protein
MNSTGWSEMPGTFEKPRQRNARVYETAPSITLLTHP